MKARALLDSASFTSFITERLAQSLHLPRSKHVAKISGIAGLTHNSSAQSLTTFKVSNVHSAAHIFNVTAIIVPRVTCELPVHHIHRKSSWNHLNGITLADPDFAYPGRIDILLGIDVFVDVLWQGRRMGPSGSPVAFETAFGWVLAGRADSHDLSATVIANFSNVQYSGDDLLREFWRIEEQASSELVMTPEEKFVINHFKTKHLRDKDGTFIVPLPRKSNPPEIGESRSFAIRRYLSLERSLASKGGSAEFNDVMVEYIHLGHAEPVPVIDMKKSNNETFYLPVHVVKKESSSTTKVRAVFDASAKSSTGFSLNDTLAVGPTVHSSLVDVLLRFRSYRYALTADVSKMYRAIKLHQSDKDFHRFFWRKMPDDPLTEYRMTRVTFGVSASSFAANMAVKQNAIDLTYKYPIAAEKVHEAFYVDDGLMGADTIAEAIEVQSQFQSLFKEGGFTLRKWNTNEPLILNHVSPELKECQAVHTLPELDHYTKTLGIEWNSSTDHFRVTVAELPEYKVITKRILISDVAKTFDVLGWYSPAIIKVKILFQRLWELKLDWDDPVPHHIQRSWSQWRLELPQLSTKLTPRCHFPKGVTIKGVQLHGFSDASEEAYAAVVYLRSEDTTGTVHMSLITSKTKVAPIKRLTIPRLELCGAHLLADLLYHVKSVLKIPMCGVYAWTDSTIILGWLSGNPRRFKTYVGNRVSLIIDQVPPDRWHHIDGSDNPADCASRGVFPSELLEHHLWWEGPQWLHSPPSEWPRTLNIRADIIPEEVKDLCFISNLLVGEPLISLDRYSSFNRLKRITAWVLRFINNSKSRNNQELIRKSFVLSPSETKRSENYWLSILQRAHFNKEIDLLAIGKDLPRGSCVLPLNPFIDPNGILRVGGRLRHSNYSYEMRHPAIIHGKHPITRLIVRAEHLRLLHAGPTLLSSSLGVQFHIIRGKGVIRDITRGCVICKRSQAKPIPPMMGQLPVDRITPGIVFEKVGIDYAGPVYVKYGPVRKPTIVKSYICVFVSLAVKAVHLELVSDLTSQAFIACLRRFIARRGKPTIIMSDHGTNFVGANRELKEFVEFVNEKKSIKAISEFCSTQGIDWKFIPERTPHFGGLWESAVKSMKNHLTKVTRDVKLTFEEYSTVITQIEACLNSRPLVAMPADSENIEVLTPGHFLIGRQLEAIPDPSTSFQKITVLRRWDLVQSIVRHFWKRWSVEYVVNLRKLTKWYRSNRNIRIGDIVIINEDGLVPTTWPLGRIIEVHHGKDNVVRVVTVKTVRGVYKRPVMKIAVLLPNDS